MNCKITPYGFVCGNTRSFDPTTSTQSGTCDKMMCDAHAANVGPNRDYCSIKKEDSK